MDIPNYEKLSKKAKGEKYIKTHYNDFYTYLNEVYPSDISFKDKWLWYRNNIKSYPVCKICGNRTKRNGSQYPIYCKQCTNKSPEKKEKIKQVNLMKYGVENISKLEFIKKKKIETVNKHYEGGYSNELIKSKRRQTNLEKLGHENALESPIIKSKINKIFNEKYGGNSPFSSKQVHEKSKATKLKKYGDSNYRNTEKMMSTCMSKYGVKSYFCAEQFRNEYKNILIKKYGSLEEAYKQISEAAHLTYFKNKKNNPKKYIESRKIVTEKAKKTNLERYGVESYLLSDEIKKSYNNNSKPNLKFEQLLKDNNIEYEREFTIKNRAYDFKVGNNLIEINPFPTHNSTWGLFNNPKDKSYHHEKMKLAKDNGYNCISIWDWDEYSNIIGLLENKTSIGARNCEIKEVDKKCCKEFLNKNHLQGDCRNQSVRLGLYYGDELVELMTFGKPRYNKNYEYELLRLCTKRGLVVNGGASKLFKHFIKNYNATLIISYCDLSKFSGKIYEDLGFTHKSTSISKHWYEPKTNTHITDNLLKQRGFDQLFKTNYGKGVSNKELMLEHGFVEIFDCGQSTYIYNSI